MTKVQRKEQEDARERLRQWVKPGDVVYCILRHVSRSGMLHIIDLNIVDAEDGQIRNLGWNAAKALGYKYDDRQGGVKMSGCGMDMGFALVYELSHALYPQGFGCVGEKCPSNEHNNGDRNYTPHATMLQGWSTCDDCVNGDGTNVAPTDNPYCPLHSHWHDSGGYALRHRWM